MPRCVICDYCSEINEYRTVSFSWSDEYNGDTCSDCKEAIFEAAFYSHEDLEDGELSYDTGESEDFVGLLKVLEERGLEEGEEKA